MAESQPDARDHRSARQRRVHLKIAFVDAVEGLLGRSNPDED